MVDREGGIIIYEYQYKGFCSVQAACCILNLDEKGCNENNITC